MHTYDWNIAGHATQRAQFETDLNNGNLAHAYLLYGAKHVGKFRFAKTCANILQCKSGLCGTCEVCVQIDSDAHYDTLVVKNDGKGVSIDQVRDIVYRLTFTSQSNFRIVIIDDVELMRPEAQNTLLKTLEEPGKDTIIFLITNDLSKVLDTIRSRCRLIKFGVLSNDVLEAFLVEKNIEVSPEVKHDALKYSFGSVGEFFRLIRDDERRILLNERFNHLIFLLDTATLVSKFKYVEEIAGEKSDVLDVLEMLNSIARTRLLLNDTQKLKMIALIERVESAKQDLEKNVNTKLVLENLFLNC